MATRYPLSDYLAAAMAQAVVERLEDDTFAGTIPPLWGVIAFGDTQAECEEELRSELEDWVY